MKEILESMETLAPKLAALEALMSRGDFRKESLSDLLGPNPKAAFSRLIEFKATLDRMRGLTWGYLEAAASAGKLPAQRIPQALKEFLHDQSTKTHSGKKTG
ncbi:MAG TPA: hypothetical protein VNX88_01630 [Terriglobales bacterium]|jgi:hypothetical protein|nr:hypothetical protein [Terriglobales bacterium]